VFIVIPLAFALLAVFVSERSFCDVGDWDRLKVLSGGRVDENVMLW
jgi:hypothetical protein